MPPDAVRRRRARAGNAMSAAARVVAAGAALVLALGAAPAGAQTWYTVELIVFEHLDDTGIHAERFRLDPGEPELAGAVELTAGLDDASAGELDATPGTPHAFRLLDAAEHGLGGAWRALRNSANFRPLLHVAWRQPGFGPQSAPPAHVTTRLAAGEDARAGPAIIDGTVRVYRSRYLHVETDLLYTRRVGDLAGTEGYPSAFRYETSRRMRSNELHYLDHPLFGLLVRVTPYALPEPEPEPQPGEPPPEDATPPAPQSAPTSQSGQAPSEGAAPAAAMLGFRYAPSQPTPIPAPQRSWLAVQDAARDRRTVGWDGA